MNPHVVQRVAMLAADRFGAIDTIIVPTTERRRRGSVQWYGLSLRLEPGGPWHFVGRRQFEADLIELLWLIDPDEIAAGKYAPEPPPVPPPFSKNRGHDGKKTNHPNH